MAEYLQAPPRRKALGLLADALTSGQEALNTVNLPYVGGLGGLLFGQAPQYLQDVSYGMPLLRGGNVATGGLGTLTPDTRMLDVATLPFVGAGAAKAGQVGAKTLGKEVARQVETGTGLIGSNVMNPRTNIVPVDDITNGLLSKYVPGVRAGEELIVQHNLTPEKLVAANKLGGMPVPSLAITKVSEPLSGFGDISLIGSKEMAIPSAKNPVFKSDAYTKRSPGIDYSIDYKSRENLKGLLGDTLKKVPNAERDFGNLIDEYKDREFNNLYVAKFLDEKGMLPTNIENPYKFDATLNELRSANRKEYENWLMDFESKLPEAGVNVKERIFKGYTPSGNRRYAPVTLENVVKEMKGGASTEGWNYGVGNIRALVTPKFKNLTEIKGSRDRILSESDFTPIKEKFNDAYFDLTKRLREVNPSFDADNAILDIAETRNYSILDEYYKDAPKNLKADIGAYLDSLKSMPTEYFEIKPQRAVDIGEFKGAIVPKDLSPQAKGILENAGIRDIYEYATPEERASLFNKFGSQMFGVGVGVPLGTGLLQDNRQ